MVKSDGILQNGFIFTGGGGTVPIICIGAVGYGKCTVRSVHTFAIRFAVDINENVVRARDQIDIKRLWERFTPLSVINIQISQIMRVVAVG